MLHQVRSKILLHKKNPEAAYQEILKEEDEYFRIHSTISILYELGRKQEADKLLSEFLQEYPTEAINIAQIYALKGDKDSAFEWLEKALVIQDPTLIEGLYYPDFKGLYSDPRWKDIINRMGLPEGHGVPMG